LLCHSSFSRSYSPNLKRSLSVEAAEAVAEVAAKKVAARNEVAEVEEMLKEVEVEEPAAAGSSVGAVREVVVADSVAVSHLGSRQAARNVAPPARIQSVAALADLVLGRVPAREAQDEQVSALVAQVSRVLERAARDAPEPVRLALENRAQALRVQVGRVLELVAQVSQVLERAARDAQESERGELEDRVQAQLV
jgi:hypothetical protein